MIFCENLVCFRSYLLVRAPLEQTLRRWTEEGRPDIVVEVLGAIRAVFRAWRALKVFFGGSGDFPGSV